MGYFDWETRYDLGIAPMNDEHKGLMRVMNELHAANAAHASHDALARTLGQLEALTVAHFEHEEKYQASIGFPGLESHRKIHKSLLESFGAHKQKFVAERKGLSAEFFAFLKLWLAAHIAGIDQKYAEYSRDAATTQRIRPVGFPR